MKNQTIMRREAEAFAGEFPAVRQLPEEVIRAWANGQALTEAYLDYIRTAGTDVTPMRNDKVDAGSGREPAGSAGAFMESGRETEDLSVRLAALERELRALKRENQALRQNERNRARAILEGGVGKGALQGARTDFLRGLQSEH